MSAKCEDADGCKRKATYEWRERPEDGGARLLLCYRHAGYYSDPPPVPLRPRPTAAPAGRR